MANPNTKMDYELMKGLYKAFDHADEVLKQVSDKLKILAADTANTYFTGIVGPSYHEHVERVCSNLDTSRQLWRTLLEEVQKVEQDFRNADAAGARDVKATE